jgi:hypothetical protein
MIRGTYKNVAFDGRSGFYWIVGCPSAGKFSSLNDLRRYVDNNCWASPRNAGG